MKKKKFSTKKKTPLIQSTNYSEVGKFAFKEKILEKEEIEKKLNIIYDLLKEKKFDKKPSELYLAVTGDETITKENQLILDHIKTITNFSLITKLEIFYKNEYDTFNKISNEKEKCSICQYNFYEEEEDEKEKNSLPPLKDFLKESSSVILLDKCTDHFFHIDCINSLINKKSSFKCPNCSKIYGVLIGDQPNGEMTAFISDKTHCDGFKKCGTIIINYRFPDGKGYTGTHREAYLPDNNEGLEVLGLLKVAFDRKLLFTVGTSVTTGQKNTTIWNGIHHKTNLYGGSTRFGYPDPTYFNRVKEELASKGVSKDNLTVDPIKIGQEFLDCNFINNMYL